MQRFIHCLDTDDDLARVHLTTPEMLAPQSRLADLGNTVIPERPIVSQSLCQNSVYINDVRMRWKRLNLTLPHVYPSGRYSL